MDTENPIYDPSLIRFFGKDIILKYSTFKLTEVERLGFSIERSISAFKQAIKISTSGDKEITHEKYGEYIDSLKFYKT